MNASCRTVSHSLKVFASSATVKQDTNSIEKSACMATSNVGNKKKYLGVHEKYPIFLPYLTKFRFSRQIFIGVPNWKRHEILFRGRRSVTCV